MTLREQIANEQREKAELQTALEAEVAAHNRIRKAAQRVYDGLHERLEHCVRNSVPLPVYDGIADLHDALNSQ